MYDHLTTYRQTTGLDIYSTTNDRARRAVVDRLRLRNVGTLIDRLRQLDGWDDDEQEALADLSATPCTYEELLLDYGRMVEKTGNEFRWRGDYFRTFDEAATAALAGVGVTLEEQDSHEVLEHYSIAANLAECLRETGEQVIEFLDLNIWCRTTSGSGVAGDACIAELAATWEWLEGQCNHHITAA